ncbi:MAG: zinc-dependent metalloprotease [Actinomycetota bacterium]
MSQQPFGDIPLFREIQKLLVGSTGPVNMEIARQVGVAVATQGVHEHHPSADVERSFADAVHASETLLAGYTRLPLIEPIPSRVVGPTWWVNETLVRWQWLLEHLGGRFTAELGRAGAEAADQDQMQVALGQVAPLIIGIQAGSLIGQLAKESIGRYDHPIPHAESDGLFFLWLNAQRVADDYGFDQEAFRRWLALRDAARHLVTTNVAWLHRFHRSLLTEVVNSIEVDTGDLERKMLEMQERGMDMFSQGVSASEMLPLAHTERHRKALDRLRALVAVLEGYAGHASEAVADKLIGDASKIEEGMARHRASPSDGRAMLASIFGVSIDRALEDSGRTFCAAVVQLKGLPALNRVWGAPDNLPTLPEIKDPFAWMERVLEDE